MTNNDRWQAFFGFLREARNRSCWPEHCDLALAIQRVAEEVVRSGPRGKAADRCRNLCLAGGVALNCVANGVLLRSERIFDKASGSSRRQEMPAGPWGQPGGALHLLRAQSGRLTAPMTVMKGSYLGAGVLRAGYHAGPPASTGPCSKGMNTFAEVCSTNRLDVWRGKCDRLVPGPHGVGAARPGQQQHHRRCPQPEMQRKLNLKIKYREGFRPFAPPRSMIECEAEFFDARSTVALHAAGGRCTRKAPQSATGGVSRHDGAGRNSTLRVPTSPPSPISITRPVSRPSTGDQSALLAADRHLPARRPAMA